MSGESERLVIACTTTVTSDHWYVCQPRMVTWMVYVSLILPPFYIRKVRSSWRKLLLEKRMELKVKTTLFRIEPFCVYCVKFLSLVQVKL